VRPKRWIRVVIMVVIVDKYRCRSGSPGTEPAFRIPF
jgi:hypothetical protein